VPAEEACVATIRERVRARDGRTVYDVRYRTLGGAQRTETFTARSRAEARARAVQVDKERGVLTDRAKGRVTLATYGAAWIDHHPSLRPSTRALYESSWRKHIEPALGRHQLARIGPDIVRKWWAQLERDGVGTTARDHAYRLLRAILNQAVRDDVIARNPCTIRGAGTTRTAERPVLTAAQVWRLADTIVPAWRPAVLLAGFGGLRRGEVLGLRRRDVDLAAGTVTVRENVTFVADELHVGPPKSAAGRRTVALPPQVLDALDLDLEPARYVLGGGREPASPKSLRTAWLNVLGVLAGELPDGLHFHDLRGTALTLAGQHGATLAELMNRAGHASPDVALRYQHATAQRDRALADAMADTIASAAGGATVLPLRRK
jgi:integrase